MTSRLLTAQSVPIPTQLAAWIANTFDTDFKRRNKGYAGSCAAFVQQIHFYITSEFGSVPSLVKETFDDGRRWIYKTYSSWQETLPWLTDYAFRKVRSLLMELGLIEVEQLGLRQSGRDRTCWYTVNYEHPFLQQLMSTDAEQNSLTDAQQINSTDASGSNSTDASVSSSTTGSVDCQRIPITTSNTTGNNLSLEGKQKEKKVETSSQTTAGSSIGSVANSNFPRTLPKISLGDKSSAVAIEAWEVAPLEPYPYFLQWRALHYKNQGGHWANSPQSNAYSEFYKNRFKTQILWQEFLQFYNLALDNALALQLAGIEVRLPSCLSDRPQANEDVVVQKAQTLAQNTAEPKRVTENKDKAGRYCPSRLKPSSSSICDERPALSSFGVGVIEPCADFSSRMVQLVKQRTLSKAEEVGKPKPQDLLQQYLEWLHSGELALVKEARTMLKPMVMSREDLEADWDESGNLIDVKKRQTKKI